jgi:hypothetical protein
MMVGAPIAAMSAGTAPLAFRDGYGYRGDVPDGARQLSANREAIRSKLERRVLIAVDAQHRNTSCGQAAAT